MREAGNTIKAFGIGFTLFGAGAWAGIGDPGFFIIGVVVVAVGWAIAAPFPENHSKGG